MRHRPLNTPLLLAAFLLLALLHLIHGQRRIADPDEYQTLVNAFDAAHGLTPYVDFWDNHGPLAIWLLQPIITLWQGGHSILHWLRALMWINTLLVAGGTWYLARRLYTPRIANIAALILLASPVFLSKAIEVRPDNPANLLATIALLTLALGLKSQRPYLFLLSGLSIGILAGFTLKAAIIAAALGVYALCWVLRSRQLPPIKNIILLAGGAIGATIILTTALASLGILQAFLDCYMGGNINRAFAGFTSSEFTRIFEKSPIWSYTVSFALIASTIRIMRRQADPAETGLTAMCLFILTQFLIFLPTKNMQSLLPVFVPLCIVSAIMLNQWFIALAAQPWWTRTASTVAAVILIPLHLIGTHLYANLANNQLPKQIAFADETLRLTPDEPYIFDPVGMVFLKPKPGPFHVLVTFIRKMHQDGTIDLQLIKLLESNNINSIVFHKRAGDLRVADVDYIRHNYGPILGASEYYLLRRGAPKDGSALPEKIQRAWQSWQWEDAIQPQQHAPAPPAWYNEFITRYNTNSGR